MSNGLKINGILNHDTKQIRSVMLSSAVSGATKSFVKFNMFNGIPGITSINSSSSEEGQVLNLNTNMKSRITNGQNLELSSYYYSANNNDYITLIHNNGNWSELARTQAPIRYNFGATLTGPANNYIDFNNYGLSHLGPRVLAYNGRDGYISKAICMFEYTNPTGSVEIRINDTVVYTITNTEFKNNTSIFSFSTTGNNNLSDRKGVIYFSNIQISAGDYLAVRSNNASYGEFNIVLVVT